MALLYIYTLNISSFTR